MKLYIVRHGETDWNKERRIQGQADIPLNGFGRHLAEETGKGLSDIAFDICISSPLSRAVEDGRAYSWRKGYPCGKRQSHYGDGVRHMGRRVLFERRVEPSAGVP